jgi:hypothetical protein
MLGTDVGRMGFLFLVVAHLSQSRAACSNVIASACMCFLFLLAGAAMNGPYRLERQMVNGLPRVR